MKAELIMRKRIALNAFSFADMVVWALPKRMTGSSHDYKYRLAYVEDEVCVLRLDNEAGKGDHLHYGEVESAYKFGSTDQLIDDFFGFIARWDRENSRT